jgi:hypothetical protein
VNPELAALQQSIQMLHQLMVHMSDPQAVAVVGKCLQALTGLQQQMMQGAQQGGPGGPPGGGPGGPPGGPQGGPPGTNPLVAALAQHLQQGGAPAPVGQ